MADGDRAMITGAARARDAAGCEACDQILHWNQVRAGDLVLHRGALRRVDAIDSSRPPALAFTFEDGQTAWHAPGDHTAVRRYLETPAPDCSTQAPAGGAGWTPEQMLRCFHAVFGHDLPAAPTTAIPSGLARLRQELLDEEVQELRDAVAAGDIAAIADAIADIVFVAVGTAVTYGLPFDAVLAEVFASNMTKTGEVGRSWAAGQRKLVKGPGFRPPDIARVLARAAGECPLP